MQHYGKCRLCGNKDETNNHIKSLRGKLVQIEYETWHNWVGNVIHRKFARNLHLTIRTSGICTTQNSPRRMRRTNFTGILTYKQITKSWPDNQTQWKKHLSNRGFCRPSRPQNKIKRKREISTKTLQENSKIWNMKLTLIPVVIGALVTVTKGLVQGLEDFEVRARVRPSRLQYYQDRPEYWGEFQRLRESSFHSDYSEKPTANVGVKTLKIEENKSIE